MLQRQDVNGAVNNDLRNQQSTAQQSANQTHKDAGRSYSNMHTSQVSTNGDASPKGDTVLSDNDVKSMNTALTESLLSLSNQTDKQAQATQQDIKALKNISYGIIASDKPTQFKNHWIMLNLVWKMPQNIINKDIDIRIRKK